MGYPLLSVSGALPVSPPGESLTVAGARGGGFALPEADPPSLCRAATDRAARARSPQRRRDMKAHIARPTATTITPPTSMAWTQNSAPALAPESAPCGWVWTGVALETGLTSGVGAVTGGLGEAGGEDRGAAGWAGPTGVGDGLGITCDGFAVGEGECTGDGEGEGD